MVGLYVPMLVMTINFIGSDRCAVWVPRIDETLPDDVSSASKTSV
jgi:hypothetical protein